MIRVFTGIYSNVLRASLISSLVDHANETFGPSSNVASVLLGTIGGCGGRYFVDVAHRLHFGQGRVAPQPGEEDNASPPPPSAARERLPELRCPSYSTRSAIVCAVVHLVAVHRAELITPSAGAALNATLLVADALYKEMCVCRLQGS